MNRMDTDPNLTMETLVYNTWWPGCERVSSMNQFDDGCGESCFSAGLMRDMEAFNRDHPGEVVHFQSRVAEGIPGAKLGAWWLAPVTTNATGMAPVVVLQHGFRSNSNKYRQQLGAYHLRKMGYGVLLTNFRDHGYSGSSGIDTYQWGDAYPYDLLGAWDYVVADPDGRLGGPRPAERVGLMGFSKGGFIAANAIGLEARVPAAWIDAPPFTPKAVFEHGARNTMTGMGFAALIPFIVDPVWSRLEDRALDRGVDLNKHLPSWTMALGPDTRRPLQIVGNEEDNTVPILELERYTELLGGMKEKYSLQVWRTSGECHGGAHVNDHLTHFDDYYGRLCRFWSEAFGTGAACSPVA